MERTQLRIYHGPSDAGEPVDRQSRHRITLPMSEIARLISDAVNSDRTWLRDFEDDEITISTDLYEVLLAYQYFRRPSA